MQAKREFVNSEQAYEEMELKALQHANQVRNVFYVKALSPEKKKEHYSGELYRKELEKKCRQDISMAKKTDSPLKRSGKV